MPGCKDLLHKNFHPRDEFINFDENSHTYTLLRKDGSSYIFPRSVSSFVKTFFKHFDSKKVIENNILKWKRDKTSKYYIFLDVVEKAFPNCCNLFHQGFLISEIWKINGERQSSLGTALHLKIEKILNGEDDDEKEETVNSNDENTSSDLLFEKMDLNIKTIYNELTSEKVFKLNHFDALKVVLTLFQRFGSSPSLSEPNGDKVFNLKKEILPEVEAWKRWRSQNLNLIPYRTEWSIYSEEHDIAGQIDAIFRDEKTGEFVIVDWKRVANMEYVSSSPFEKEKFGKHPFQKIPDTNFGHYTLQVNLYEMILKRFYGIVITKKVLVQIHPSLPFPGFVEHLVP